MAQNKGWYCNPTCIHNDPWPRIKVGIVTLLAFKQEPLGAKVDVFVTFAWIVYFSYDFASCYFNDFLRKILFRKLQCYLQFLPFLT